MRRKKQKEIKGFRLLLIKLVFGLAALSLGFLSSNLLSSEFGASTVPELLPDGSDKCNTGLFGDPCMETDMNISGPEDVILKSWFFSEAIPWWISYFIVFTAGVSVLMIMIGGIMLLVAGDNQELRGKGIKTIVWALVGLLIAMFAFTIITIISNLPLPGATD